jgi:hypothetical protein
MRPARAVLAPIAALLLFACSSPPAEETTPTPPAPIENAALRLRLATLPEGWRMTAGDGARWAFAAPLGETAGTATIEVATPASPAVNLVEEAKAYGEAAAAAEGGKFFGGNELVTPYGSAYTVRVLVEGGTAEERAVLLLHPDGSGRLLRIGLRYPPGEGETARGRLKQALELVGALEPLAAAP